MRYGLSRMERRSYKDALMGNISFSTVSDELLTSRLKGYRHVRVGDLAKELSSHGICM